MNKLASGIYCTLLCLALPTSSLGFKRDTVVVPNTKVADVDLGGLSVTEAKKKLHAWWEGELTKEAKLRSPIFVGFWTKAKVNELGVSVDEDATLASIPTQDTYAAIQDHAAKTYNPVFKLDGYSHLTLMGIIRKAAGGPRPARVFIRKGLIVARPEVSDYDLNDSQWLEAVSKGAKDSWVVQVPLIQGPKRISDDQVAQISDVVTSFSTKFPKRQYSRNSNIKLASSILDGIVLLPGESLSFNGTVGKRTVERGFKLAGVYKNGRHDTGIGGGICQVSTTLYNACIFSNLKILRRSNHSMPVAYVPLGRDATVDYGNLDLVIQNNHPTPIAISSAFVPGQLTFRILGKKEEGLVVKLQTEGGKSWDVGTRLVRDPKLPVGARDVIEKGSRGHSLTTYRLVYKNGVLINKEILNRSYYGGGERIVAVGPSPVTPAPAPGIPSSVTPVTGAFRH